jgi:hypothetical protein
MRNAYNILVGKPEGKRTFGRLGRRLEDNIRMDLTEIEWEAVDWMNLARDRDWFWAPVNMTMKLRVKKW